MRAISWGSSNSLAHKMKVKKQKVTLNLFDTYLTVIRNSVGSKIFRNFYAEVDGKKTDIMKNGIYSCAWFVSSLLYLLKLIKQPHATVDGTIKDLKQSGWKKIKKPKIGSVLLWELIDCGNNEFHRHIGFYVGNNKAVSTSQKLKCPVIHHWTYGIKKNRPIRKIEAIFWNKKLKI